MWICLAVFNADYKSQIFLKQNYYNRLDILQMTDYILIFETGKDVGNKYTYSNIFCQCEDYFKIF